MAAGVDVRARAAAAAGIDELTLTSDTTTLVQVTGSNLIDGSAHIPVGHLSWRPSGSSEAWTPSTSGAATLDGTEGPGTTQLAYDLQLSLPISQLAG